MKTQKRFLMETQNNIISLMENINLNENLMDISSQENLQEYLCTLKTTKTNVECAEWLVNNHSAHDSFFIYLDEIDKSYKWSLMRHILMEYGPQSLTLDLVQGCYVMNLNGRHLHSFIDIVKALHIDTDHNQMDVANQFHSILTSLPFMKEIETTQRTFVISSLVSLMSHLYALRAGPSTWFYRLTQFAGIAAIMVSISSVLKYSVHLREIQEALIDFNVIKSSISASTDTDDLTSSQYISHATITETLSLLTEHFIPKDETLHTCHSTDGELFTIDIGGPRWDEFLTTIKERFKGKSKMTIHVRDQITTIGSDGFVGCIVKCDRGGFVFYPADQPEMSAEELLSSNMFTGIIGIIYTSMIAFLSRTGMTNAKEILEFSRLKDSMIKSVKDIREFSKFVAEDILNITTSATQRSFDIVKSQLEINQNYLEKPILYFCQDPTTAYELRTAVNDSVEIIEKSKVNADTRTSMVSLLNLLSNSITALKERSNKVQEKIRTMASRPDVTVIHLWGLPGVGKTALIRHLIPKIAKKLGIKPDTYAINLPKNGHWPTYAGQKFAIYDEFGARGHDDPITEHMNGLCSSGYFSMNGAELTEKPQPCAIRVLFVISNQPRWNVTKTLLPSVVKAYWSRMTTYQVYWKDYTPDKRLMNVNRKSDFSHLEFFHETYENEDNKFNALTSTSMSLDSLVDSICHSYAQHETTYLKGLETRQDLLQSSSSQPLVFNISGPRRAGKTHTFRKTLIPALREFLFMKIHVITHTRDLIPRPYKAVYIIDDVLTSDATQDTITSYVSFYNSLVSGSIIFLVSNMKHSRSYWMTTVSAFPIPMTYLKLTGAYYDNDAIIRRMGLEGWLFNKNGWYYEPVCDTQFVFDGHQMTGNQTFDINSFCEHIIAKYQEHLTNAESIEIVDVTGYEQISEEDLDDYLQFRFSSVAELSSTISKGGVSIFNAIRNKSIIIPASIYQRFDASYPVSNFQFNPDPNYLESQISRLLAIFRSTCSDADVFISCGEYKLRTYGRVAHLERPTHAGKNVEFSTVSNGQQYVQVTTSIGDEIVQDLIPARDLYAWIKGDARALQLQHLNYRDYQSIKRYFMSTPVYTALEIEHAQAQHRREFQRLQARIVPPLINVLEKIPVIKIMLGICIATTVVVATKTLVKWFSESEDIPQKKQGKRNVATKKIAVGGFSDQEPDPTDFPLKKGHVIEHLSKDTQNFIDWERFDKAYKAYTDRMDKPEMFKLSLNDNIPAVDQVVSALHNASVQLISNAGNLVGHMTHDRFGISNAHFIGCNYSIRTNKDQTLAEYLDDFEFSVQKDDCIYKARPIRYASNIDQFIFFITNKEFPAARDIRSLFLTNDKLKDGWAYEAALVKYRSGGPILEKCNAEYMIQSPIYYSNPVKSGVLSRGISLTFITSENNVATKDGDCGSFYILTGQTPSQNQHARIIGMHVGLRRGLYPHACSLYREMLYGNELVDTNQLVPTVTPIIDPHYSFTGEEILSPEVKELVDNAVEIDDPFAGTTISTYGSCPKIYAKGLDPCRISTGVSDLVEEVFGTTSKMIPTSTSKVGIDHTNTIKVNGRHDILATQFKPYGEKLGEIDEDLLLSIINHLDDRYRVIYKKNPGLATFDQAVNGYPEHHPLYGKMNRLNMDSSAGYYFKEKYGIVKKKEFFELKGDQWVLRDTKAAIDFKVRALNILDYLLAGVAYQTLTQVRLKGELRPVEKVKEGRIRTFDNTDASVVMAHRMLLVNAIISFQDIESRNRGGPQIGQNALLDFPGYVTRFGTKKLIQADFSQYDRRLHPQVIKAAYYLSLRVNGHKKTQALKIANALTIQTCYSFKIVGSLICKTHQGISSGMFFTSLGDSICNEIMMYYTVSKATPCTLSWISANFDPIILGDDISIAVTKEVESIPDILSSITTAYTAMGMKVTSADKKGEISFDNPTELAFCSRTIRTTRSGKIVCPLKKTTILALFEWVTPIDKPTCSEDSQPMTTQHQIVVQINEALGEAALHSPTTFKLFHTLTKKILTRMREKKIPQSILNSVDLRYHLEREIEIENKIMGRRILNNSLQIITNSDYSQINMEAHAIVLVEEWCNHFKLDKPILLAHTLPSTPEGVQSRCVIEVGWKGKKTKFNGIGQNKKESKLSAYKCLVEYFHITPLPSKDNLLSFCKSKMIHNGATELRTYKDGVYYVFFTDPAAGFRTVGSNIELQMAVYEARELYYQKSQSIHIPTEIESQVTDLDENGQIHRLNNRSPVLPNEACVIEEASDDDDIPCCLSDDHNQMDAGPGMTMNASSASAPPPPVGLTPAAGAMPEPATEPTSLVNIPEGLAELENINQPPDMLPFGGVDFTIMDMAYRQTIDHIKDRPINQNVPRGTVLLVQSYDPTKLNGYIRNLCDLHNRFTGPLHFRIHTIGNPVFMGEVSWAWLPDVRHLKEGDIIEDEEYQKYLWVNFNVNQSWTKHFALADARRSLFYRSTDTEADDLVETRPGFVIVMYRAVVNPFAHPEAACYFNVGSFLAQTFRFSDPKMAPRALPPSGVQTESVNSISGRTVGTVFSEYGLLESPQIFMATDGRQYPVVGAPLQIPSTAAKWFNPKVEYPAPAPYTNQVNGSASFRKVSHRYCTVESAINAGIIPQICTKNYGTGTPDHATMLIVGTLPGTDYPGGNSTVTVGYALAANSIDGVISRLSTNTGIDLTVSTTNSITVSYYPTVLPASVATSMTRSLILSWNNNKATIYFFTQSFSNLANDTLLNIRGDGTSVGNITASVSPVFQYNLVDNEAILRWSENTFPVYTGAFSAPTSSATPLEIRLMNFFNTLTSGTNGFVQFSLFDPDRRIVIAVVRYDNEVGFVINAANSFSQYNGRNIAALVFTDVRFGDRTVLTRTTDTSSWLLRQGSGLSMPLSITPRETVPPLLIGYKYGHAIPEDHHRRERSLRYETNVKMATLERSMKILTTNDKPQAMIGMAVAGGALQGIGSGINEWQNRKFTEKQNELDRNLHWDTTQLLDKQKREMQKGGFVHELTMQGNMQTHDQRMANLNSTLGQQDYSANREVDMRQRLQMAGALAPVNNTAASRASTASQSTQTMKGPAPPPPNIQGATVSSSSA